MMHAIISPSVIMVCLFGKLVVVLKPECTGYVLIPPGPEGRPSVYALDVMSLTATIRIPTIAISITAPRIAA